MAQSARAMDSPSRRRACAPPDWDVNKYVELFESVLDPLHPASLEMLFGPWANTASHVTPTSMVRLAPLLDLIVTHNSDAVIHGARMEAAVKIVITNQPYLAPLPADSLDIAHRFTDHVMACLKKLRVMKQEDDSITDHARWLLIFNFVGPEK